MTSRTTEHKARSQGLKVSFASDCHGGVKPTNEDAVACYQPDSQHEVSNKGICLSIADGVSSAEAGREASLFCTGEFVKQYYQTPDTWSVSHAGQKTLTAINLKLFKKSHEFVQEEKGYLCTFSCVVVKSQIAHFFHVGDSRVYLFRAGSLSCLSRDHTVKLSKDKYILSRAVGMDNCLQIDYGKRPLLRDDILLLTTDGIHDFLSDADITQVLSSPSGLADKTFRLRELALQNGSDDNLSCVVANIDSLPSESLNDFNEKLTRLPFPPFLEPGMSIDGYRIDKEIFASSRSQVYLVTDTQTQKQMVMKTPSENFQGDTHYIDRFIQEEWIGKRIKSDYVVAIVNQNRARHFLYYLMEYVAGKSLQEWMQNNPTPGPKYAINIIKQIAKALSALHDMETIHQDLKPANILLDADDNVKVIDFGSVYVAGIAEIFTPIEHEGALGTATYSDPHYLRGKNTGVQGDIYALATICYELFSQQLPYGSAIEQCTNPNDFDKLRYNSIREFNPGIPVWFDRALEKAVHFDLNTRYSNLEDFLLDITQPNPQFLHDDPQLQNSRGLLFWQLMSGFWVLMLILVVLVFSST